MATMTIAQALASNATGITVADTPANIAAALSNGALLARVSLFTLNANGASSVYQAKLLYALGAKFSRGSYSYTIRDSFAALNDPVSAAALNIGSATAVFDTASNLLAAAGTSIMQRAASVLMSSSASVTHAELTRLEALPAFSVLPGQSITLTDSAANLLTLTAGENRPSIKAYHVSINSTVTLSQARTLEALPGFAVTDGATMLVSGSVATMTAGTVPAVAAVPRVAVDVTDTFANVLQSVAALVSLAQSVPNLSVTMMANATASVAQVAQLLPLSGRFSVSPGHALTLLDTAASLLAASAGATSLAQVVTLSASASVTAAQLAVLTALHGFSVAGGVQLAVTGTLADLGMAQLDLVTSVTVQDTVTHLIQAASLPAHTAAIVAQLDTAQYDAAQAARIGLLAANGITLTLVPAGSVTSMTIADTLENLASFAPALGALVGHGSVSLLPTDSNVTLTAVLATALIGLNAIDMTASGVSVADSGTAITVAASQLFGHGLVSVNVTSGMFVGTLAQLLDPVLHFTGAGGPFALRMLGALALAPTTASAQLGSDATVGTNQLIALSLLPGFSVADGVTLAVHDTAASLAATADIVDGYATAVAVTDTATLTAAQAAALAEIRSTVGSANFSMAGHPLTISDSATALTDPANAAGVALASSLTLASNSVASATQAIQLVTYGATFSLGGNGLTVIDSAAALAMLAGDNAALAAVNAWGGQVVLSGDATLTVDGVHALQAFTGFSAGNHHLTIADNATNLLATGSADALAVAFGVQLAAAATVAVTDAASLAALHGFSTNGNALTIADTPAHLAAMGSSIAALATAETFVPRTVGNAADYTISAAQLAALQTLTGLSTVGLTGTITVSDLPDALVALAPAFQSIGFGSLLSRVVVALSADAAVAATTASALAKLPGFNVAGHLLAVHDTPAALLAPGAASGLAVAGVVGVVAATTVSVSEATALAALQNFAADAYPLTILDSPANLALLPARAAAIAAGIAVAPSSNETIGDYTVTAVRYLAMASIANLSFAGFSGTLTVLDTAANLIALAGEFASAAIGTTLSIARGATVVALSSDATVSASGLAALTGLPWAALNGHSLTVQDSPVALLATFASGVPLATAVVLAGNAGPWTVSAVDAAHLAAMSGFSAGSAGMLVLDTVANILAPQNAGGLAAASGVVLSADASVTAANAAYLATISHFSVGSAHLTIQDRAGALAALDAPSAALASSILLQGSGLVSVAQFAALRALPHFSAAGGMLVVIDTADNLATLAGTPTGLASMIALSADAILSAAQAEALATLPHFTGGSAQIAVVDSAANLLHVTGPGTQPDNWAGELAATIVTLSTDATITAAQAAEFAMLGSRFSRAGHRLVIADTAANLLTPINAVGLGLATAVTLSGNEIGLTAAAASALAAIVGFDKGTRSITVSDNATNILLSANAAGLVLADHVQLSAAAALSVATAEALVGLATYQANAGAVLSISDTLPNLLSLAGASLANNAAVLQTTPIGLSADATATVAQLAALALLPEYGGFTRNGNALVLQDTGRHLAAYTPDGVALPTAYAMVGDATLTAAQANLLAARATDLSDNSLTIADTPAALLDPANAAGNALAAELTLSGNAMVTAAQVTALVGDPRFEPGHWAMAVQDSAAALLGLSVGASTMASSLVLAASQTVDAAALLGLASLGNKFSLAGHVLTVQDTAAALAGLTGGEKALAGAEVLGTSATVGAATASLLAALPNFSLAGGVTLTVQDGVANLIGLSAAAQAIAAAELLPPGITAAVTAQQAAALAALPHFSGAGATVVVNDSIADLIVFSGWQGLATYYVVTDSLANLTAAASSPLLTGAQAIVPAAGGDIDAATAAILAGLGTFNRGGLPLTVTDTPAQIAANAAAILAIAATARVDAPTPIGMTQADALVALQNAGKLGFAPGVTLWLEDTYAALTDVSHAAALALATTVTVLDSPAIVLAAAAHNWGAAVVNFALSSGGTVTGVQAATLAGLGTHFQANGQMLTMADTVAGVVGHAAALATLGISAQVTDTTAHVVANIAALIARGDRVTLVTLTDSTPVTAAQADALQYLAPVLAGDPLTVGDTAAAIAQNLSNLLALGAHLGAVDVSDNAANVASSVAAIQGLGSLLHIALTDTAPIPAATAAALLPLLPYLAGSTSIGVTDTGAAIASQSAALASLGGALGIVTLSDGTTVSAGVASGLIPIDSHLGIGIVLDVADNAAALVGAATAIGMLRIEGRLGTIAATDSAADIVGLASGLMTLGASATVRDTGANVLAAVDSLELLGGILVTSIAFTDSAPPVLTMTVARMLADSDAIALIGSAFGVTINDTAANLQADLSAAGSTILAHLGMIGSIVASDGGGIALPEFRAVAAGVADGVASAMHRFSGGTFTVTGVLASQIATVAALAVTPTAMTVSDTAADIQADLASGNSQLLAHRTMIAATVVSDNGVIVLTDAQARAAHVDDGPASVFSVMSGETLVVTGVPVANVGAILALGVPPVSFSISDTASNIQADLASGAGSRILANRASIDMIAVVGGGTIALTEAQVLASGVDDGAGSIFAKLSGTTLTVTQVSVADIGTIVSLPVQPFAIAVSDTAAHIRSDLIGGASQLLGRLALISGIAITDSGTIVLTTGEAAALGVDNGAGSALAKLTGGSFVIADAAVADLATVDSLFVLPGNLSISDTAANIQSDLVSGASKLLANRDLLSVVAVSDAGTIALNTAQITAAGVDDSAGALLAKTIGGAIAVTGATVADFAALDSLNVRPGLIAVSDTAAHVQADLVSGASKLAGHVPVLGSVSITDAGTTTFTLTVAQLAADLGALNAVVTPYVVEIHDTVAHVQADLAGGFSVLGAQAASLSSIVLTDGGTPTITLNVAQLAADGPALARIGSLYRMIVSDTALHVEADLAAGAASHILTNSGHLAGIFLPAGSVVALTEQQATYPGIAAALAQTTGLVGLTISGATVAQIPAVLAIGIAGTTIGILDSAADVQNDLTGGASSLLAHHGLLTGIAFTDSATPTIFLTVGQLAGDALVLDQISSSYGITILDSALQVQTDLALGGSSAIVMRGATVTNVVLTGPGTITLTEAQAVHAGVAAALEATVGLTGVLVTNTTVGQIGAVLGLGIVQTTIQVLDSAAQVQDDLASGASVLLANITSIGSIQLSDGGTPRLALTLSQFVSNAPVLQVISVHHIAINDTATNVQADLRAGAASTILGSASEIDSIVLTSGNTISLTEAQATYAGVRTALSEIAGLSSLLVTDATVAQIGTVLGLSIANTSISVADTATNVQADLALCGTSAILSNIGAIGGIALTVGSIITLTEAQATYAGVPALLRATSGLTGLIVTDTAVSQISTVLALGIAGTMMDVADTAAHVQADLVGGSSILMADIARIGSIALTDGTTPTIALSIAQFDADAAVRLAIASACNFAIADTAAAVQSDLASGSSSVILTNFGALSGIALTSGTSITLTEAEVTVPNVVAALAETSGLSGVRITGVSVSQLAVVLSLGIPVPTTIDLIDTAAAVEADLIGGSSVLLSHVGVLHAITLTDAGTSTITLSAAQLGGDAAVLGLIGPAYRIDVSDTASHIEADLAAGASSAILAQGSHLSGITLTSGTAITLTAAQATYAGVGTVLHATSGLTSLIVTGATVGQVSGIVGLGVAGTLIHISDTAANVQSDLAAASSVLLANSSASGGITLSDGGTPTIVLSVAEIAADTAVLDQIVSPYHLAVADTASNVQADLAAGAASVILGNTISGVTLTAGSSITLTGMQATHAGVGAALGMTTGLAALLVTETTVAQISAVLGLSIPGISIGIADAASAIESDLTGGSSTLLALGAGLHEIALTDASAPTITLTVGQLAAEAAVVDLIGSPWRLVVEDTGANIQADLALGAGSAILTHTAVLNGIVLPPGSTVALTEAQAVHAGVAAVLADAFGLTRFDVTGVDVSQLGTVLALGVAGTTIAVTDTAAHIQADLAGGSSLLLANVSHLDSITLGDSGTPAITLDVAQLNDNASVLAKIASPHDIAVSDTATNVQADLAHGASSRILSNGAATITLTSGNSISLTVAEATYAGVAGALAGTVGLTTFMVTGAAVSDVTAIVGLSVAGTKIAITDLATNVSADLADGSSVLLLNVDALDTIVLTDGGTPMIALDVGALVAEESVLQKISSTYNIAVSDLATNVASDLTGGASALLANVGHIAGITLTDGGTPSMALSVVQVNADSAVLALITSAFTIDVVGTAAEVQSDLNNPSSALAANLTHISSITLSDVGTPTIELSVAGLSAGAGVLALIGSSFDLAVVDTAAHVEADLASGGFSIVLGALATVDSITLTSGSVITLTESQVLQVGVDDGIASAIHKLTNGTLVVTDVLVADIGTVLTGLDIAPTNIAVKDSAANIVADIGGAGGLATNAAAVTTVTTTESTVDVATATTIYNALHGIFDESGLTVGDTAAALLTAATATPAMLSAAARVAMSDNPTGLTAAQATTLAGLLGSVLGIGQTMEVADSASNLLLGANAAGIALATTVTLDAPASMTADVATQLAGLHAFVPGPAITVQDTIASLIDPSHANGINVATTTQLDADYTVSAATLTALAGLHGYSAGPHALTVQDSVNAILPLTQPALGFAHLVAVSDTVATVTANIAGLQAQLPAHGHALSITLTDAAANVLAIATTAADYAANAAAYAAISTAGVIKVSGDASGLAAIAAALAVNGAVGEVDVSDTAANILSSLTTLTSVGSKFTSATISDASVNAVEVAALLSIPNLTAPGLTITDTGSQIAAAILADAAPGLNFMNAHNVTLSADSVVAAADAQILEQLTTFSKNGYHLYVWDTAAHLTDSADGYLAAVQAGIVDGVYLKAAGHTATISASLAASLLSISAFNRNDPPAGVGDGLANALIVQDTAAHIDAVSGSLNANRAALSSIMVTASATVTDAVFGDLLMLGATMDAGKTLTVRDTAANIIANVASQTSGSPSIVPVAWQISGSASVTTAGAILLASLPGFSIGAYTLTLTDNATISVADANSLGTLGSSLRLSAHHLDVNGSVATMTTGPGLSANAKLIVTPHITDTFANVATLTTGSGLLSGTITVSDSEAVTVSQAAAFLALLGGSGIPAANVSFGGHVESVTDTLSNIQILTGSAGWTSNLGVHGDFSLIVADTVTNLTSPSNTAAFAAMAGTTFSANQTVLAASAEALFALENTIHFSKGSFTLTIQDTVANLLNTANIDGVAIADVLQLSADGTVAAADAEALLANSRFHLNHTLTISDSSDNLLDGVLSGDISGSAYAGSVVVQLAAPETLDAGTATALVNLPGFVNNGDLTISDGASYLLNPNNHAAEVAASSVTLSGDETVSIATAARLAALPHFTIGSNVLHLASNDYADAATLTTIADFGAGFDSAGFTIKLTQDALTLTPTEYTALQSDNVQLNGHALSALATGISVTSGGGTVHVSGAGISGATLNVYSSSGSSLSQTAGVGASFTASASEGSIGNGVVVTETIGGSAVTGESAPIIALEQTLLTNAAAANGATFAGTGAVQVGVGQYTDLYSATTAPTHPTSPVLVFDPNAHTLSLNIDGHSPVLLVTLGTATHPTALTAAEIFIQHFT